MHVHLHPSFVCVCHQVHKSNLPSFNQPTIKYFAWAVCGHCMPHEMLGVLPYITCTPIPGIGFWYCSVQKILAQVHRLIDR